MRESRAQTLREQSVCGSPLSSEDQCHQGLRQVGDSATAPDGLQVFGALPETDNTAGMIGRRRVDRRIRHPELSTTRHYPVILQNSIYIMYPIRERNDSDLYKFVIRREPHVSGQSEKKVFESWRASISHLFK